MKTSVLLLSLAATVPAAAAPTAIQCGQVFDSKAAKVLGPHTIVVEDGRISAIHAGKRGAEWPGFINLDKHTCMPGWIDMHVHLSGESGPGRYTEGFRLNPEHFAFRSVAYAERTLLAGFTTVRDLGGDIALAMRDSINEGVLRGPRIFAAGKSIASTGGHGDPTNGLNAELSHLIGPPGPTEGVINSPDQARQAVRQRYKDGSDLIKITATGGVLSYAKSADAPQFTVDEIAVVVQTAKDYGYTVAAHAHGAEGMKRAVLAGVNSIEHGTYMNDEIMRLMKERGTWYVPTISAGNFVREKAKEEGYYPEIIRPKAARVGAQIQATFEKAYKAGVPIAFGTDAGVFPHGDNAGEFVLMTQSGMSAQAALQTATFNSAKALGADDLGQIAPGFKADIIAVEGNPVENIELVRSVNFVMKDGKIFKQ